MCSKLGGTTPCWTACTMPPRFQFNSSNTAVGTAFTDCQSLPLLLCCCCRCPRFLDRLDPDSSLQAKLGVQQAWLNHPLLDCLCEHPAGVQELLQRVHFSQPPLHTWALAAAGGGAGVAGAGAGGARGVSPGKVVLALLFKMGKAYGGCRECWPLGCRRRCRGCWWCGGGLKGEGALQPHHCTAGP